MNPTDLESFWKTTIAELAGTEINPVVEELAEQSHREFTTYSVVLHSLQNQRIRAWYSVPNDPPLGGRFPAILAVPGYTGNKPVPVHLAMAGFAVLTLFPRGQGESSQEWQVDHGTKLTYHLGNKEKYYYRAAYMDCLRGVDFLCAQDKVDAARIGMWSRSQGGGLVLTTASLDSRLRVAIAEEPFLCNYPESTKLTTQPYRELHDYLEENPQQRQTALDMLAYFDPLNLVENIQCPTLVDIGMKDQTCPFHTIMPVFERITAAKALHVYPDLAHSTCTDFNAHAMSWLQRYLGR